MTKLTLYYCLCLLVLTIAWLCINTVFILNNDISTTDVNVISLPYKDVNMIVTAYCPCEKCCDEYADGITASGEPAEGFLIAAPKIYPFGTYMVVEGYADDFPVPVKDRGGAIVGNKIDLLFPTHQEALNWGIKEMKVKVIR